MRIAVVQLLGPTVQLNGINGQRRFCEHAIRDQADFNRHVECPLEPGRTLMGAARSRLASFELPCVQAARDLFGGWGWQ